MTKPFANFKEDLGFFCSENEIDNENEDNNIMTKILKQMIYNKS